MHITNTPRLHTASNTPPQGPVDTPPADPGPPQESVILKGAKAAAKYTLGSLGAVGGGAVGAIKGAVQGGATDKLSETTESGRLTRLARLAGAAVGLGLGAAAGVVLAPAGVIGLAVAAPVALGLLGAGIGGSAPEILSRAGKSGVEAGKQAASGAVAGWNLATAPFQEHPPEGQKA
ncbi:MAG: hypothetical protein KC910_14630 [Candidatus Eremiobacteraeota bacterium]|nr:hypothetical protein [Candidatus Eremiobacteraeota bacterium]